MESENSIKRGIESLVSSEHYYYNGSLNQNLHRISECVLESMNVSYGGDRYKAYEGGKPVVTNLTLNIKELDLITREKAEQGI